VNAVGGGSGLVTPAQPVASAAQEADATTPPASLTAIAAHVTATGAQTANIALGSNGEGSSGAGSSGATATMEPPPPPSPPPPPPAPPMDLDPETLPRTMKLAGGGQTTAHRSKPFLAMLPLSDQTNAKDGHVLMMPVQLSYQTMALLLAWPPLDTPFMTATSADELCSAMEALVHSGSLRVTHTDDGPTVGFMPGQRPPNPGEKAPPPAARSDEQQVQDFQVAARDALRKQIDDATLSPQMATPMEDLGFSEPAYPPPAPPSARKHASKALKAATKATGSDHDMADAVAEAIRQNKSPSKPKPKPSDRQPAHRPRVSAAMARANLDAATALAAAPLGPSHVMSAYETEARAIVASSAIPSSALPPMAAAAISAPVQPPTAAATIAAQAQGGLVYPPTACSAAATMAAPLVPPQASLAASLVSSPVVPGMASGVMTQHQQTWQDHLVGWQIEAQQYTSGAIVRGQVRSWDAEKQLFVLAFENGSVEPAYLPQSSVRMVDARGHHLDWDAFFRHSITLGLYVGPEMLPSPMPMPIPQPVPQPMPMPIPQPVPQPMPRYVGVPQVAAGQPYVPQAPQSMALAPQPMQMVEQQGMQMQPQPMQPQPMAQAMPQYAMAGAEAYAMPAAEAYAVAGAAEAYAVPAEAYAVAGASVAYAGTEVTNTRTLMAIVEENTVE